jgi:DegV family protein with EDD domain
MSYTVMMDGSLDVPPSLVKEYNIPIVAPLVLIDGKELLSGVDITLDEFFQRQRTAATLPKTSQPSPGQFVEAFENALKNNERVLYIGISNGLSGTVNSARQAAANFPADQIVIHDTMTIAAEGGMQVVTAAKVKARGGSIDEALAAAKKVQATSQMFFTVDDLTFLIKGGRIGRVSGAIGGLLNIKPIITVDKSDGKLHPHSRIRTLKAVMGKLVELAVDTIGSGNKARLIVLHGDMPAEAEQVATQLRSALDVVYLDTVRIAPTLGAHTGPKAVGVVAVPGDWE